MGPKPQISAKIPGSKCPDFVKTLSFFDPEFYAFCTNKRPDYYMLLLWQNVSILALSKVSKMNDRNTTVPEQTIFYTQSECWC